MTDRVLPSVFVSHGAPTLAMEKNDTVEFLRKLGAELGRPRAILCVSAHWATRVPTLSAAERPETIHDFGGFPELLDYRRLAPHAELAHPTDEHLLPLFVAAGAGLGEAPGLSLHRGWTHGSLSMAAYAFGEVAGDTT